VATCFPVASCHVVIKTRGYNNRYCSQVANSNIFCSDMIIKAMKDKGVVSKVFHLFYFMGNKQIGEGS
jgi:hypothetical protein